MKARYQKIVDKALFNYLFTDQEITENNANIFNFNFASDFLFQKVAIKSIVSLHQNYSGEYQTKLESFYVKSKLVNYSLRKLNSKKWYRKVEGIRDLSNLKYQEAFDKIKACLTHKHEMVQAEALIALLKMKGIEELIEQKNSKLFLNDWIQSNLLFTIKSNRINEVKNLNELLESENESIQLLGVRLIMHFHDANLLTNLEELDRQTTSEKLKSEIAEAVKHINIFYNKVI